jgi:hypothetical protein
MRLEDRIGRMEHDIRRVRIVLLLLLVVASGLLLTIVLPQGRAQAVAVFAATALLLAGAETAVYVWRRGHGVPDIVRAKKFEVVDDSGHIFVEIGETTDGRGAVVTHDGDTHLILTPAHAPPSGHADEARNPGAARTDAASVAGERTAESSAHLSVDSQTAATISGAVDVELIYRGDGVYEAKITEREDAGETAKPAETGERRR